MHAVMLTSRPPLLYWSPRTIEVVRSVWELRKRGTEAYFTIDAGPNVHILTRERDLLAVEGEVRERFQCRIIVSGPGAGATVVTQGERGEGRKENGEGRGEKREGR